MSGYQAPATPPPHNELPGLTNDDHTLYTLIVNTDSQAGRTLYVGTVTPSNPVQGDVWIDTN